MNQHDQIPDLREKGRAKDGSTIYSERRLWLQFLAFGDCRDTAPLINSLSELGQPCALYADLNDPRGVGLAWMHEDPAWFVDAGRSFLNDSPFAALTPKLDLAMTGRSYAIGYESDLDEALIQRPRGRVLDPALRWAIWYPVRRTKDFEAVPENERHEVMMDHGAIGKSFGKAGLAHDIRLACHGLDKNDNDFVIGILSAELIAASAVVQAMRKSLQTMHHIDNLGPFFTGKVIFQAAKG